MEGPAVVQKRNKPETREKAIQLLEKVGLGDKVDYYPFPAIRWATAEGRHRKSPRNRAGSDAL